MSRVIVMHLSWRVVGEEWCLDCNRNTRLRVEGTVLTEQGVMASPLKAHYCPACKEDQCP